MHLYNYKITQNTTYHRKFNINLLPMEDRYLYNLYKYYKDWQHSGYAVYYLINNLAETSLGHYLSPPSLPYYRSHALK